MRINHNMAALNTYSRLSQSTGAQQKSLEKLSSGLRINRAGDDAAGLAISEKMRAQIRGLDQAGRNAQDGISLIQTAEGALNETHSILQRMRELAVQASNDTNTTSDRAEMQKEIDQLTSEINRISNTTEFNTMKLLDGSVSATASSVTSSNWAAGATTLTNLNVAPTSTLETGTYDVDITDVTTNSKSVSAFVASASVTGVDISASSGLGAVTYGVDLSVSHQIASISGPALDNGVTSVDIASNSTMAPGAKTLTTTRTDSVSGFAGGGSGLTGVTIGATDAAGVTGSYTISTASTVGTITATGGAQLAAPSGNTITFTAASDSALVAGEDYQLMYVEETAGQFSAQIMDSTGTAVSEKVILDNSTQTYDFYMDNGGAGSGAKMNVQLHTGMDINNTLDVANAGGKFEEFDVNTTLTLKQGSTTLDTDTVLASDIAGSKTLSHGGTDFTVAVGAGDTLVGGTNASFNITNTLSATIDGGTTNVSFNAGQTGVDMGEGLTFDAAALSNFAANGPEDSNFTVGVADQYKATLVDNVGAAVAGVQEIMVSNGGSYDFGNGVSFDVGVAADATTNFTVANTATTVTNATLEVQGGATVATLSNIGANDTLDFGNGVTVDVAARTNGTASFDVDASTTDASLTIQVGANTQQTLSVGVNDMRAAALGLSSTSGVDTIVDEDGNTIANAAWTTTTNADNDGTAQHSLDVASADKATAAVKVLDVAVKNVSAERSKLGAYQNRLEHTINNLSTSAENLTAAESRIRDVDMAKEMMEFTKNNILNQAATAMLAQANQQPQTVLQLLK